MPPFRKSKYTLHLKRVGTKAQSSEAKHSQSVIEERLAINRIYLAAGLTDEEMLGKTTGTYALHYSNLTWQVLHDRITPYEVPSEPPPGCLPNEAVPEVIFTMNPRSFNLQAGEVRVWGLTNVWLKQAVTTTAYVGGYSGASVRVASGLWYRFGGLRGHKEQSTSVRDLDCGELLSHDTRHLLQRKSNRPEQPRFSGCRSIK